MTARGIRNNNPGNIRLGDHWQGMSMDQDDKDFIMFETMTYGIRALGIVLRNYQRIHGLDTLRTIIRRWAPSSENDTAAYIAAVVKDTGFGVDQNLNLSDRATLWKLARAIIIHETGADASEIPLATISRGVDMALKA